MGLMIDYVSNVWMHNNADYDIFQDLVLYICQNRSALTGKFVERTHITKMVKGYAIWVRQTKQ